VENECEQFSVHLQAADAVIGVDNGTIGEILKENGYATSWFGKNHNTTPYLYSTVRANAS